ncbi:hypothetical protein BCR39DRAFT_6770 [Naematelia encephala]|uniref:Uncharacterized protein n=1 Tax=Naematelia encephala TaxID=71784 RepID=A0A1Y2BL90_9TREE|nr:hypothetical protein BCR39DRAFT_6770 [Naematelia encephala]
MSHWLSLCVLIIYITYHSRVQFKRQKTETLTNFKLPTYLSFRTRSISHSMYFISLIAFFLSCFSFSFPTFLCLSSLTPSSHPLFLVFLSCHVPVLFCLKNDLNASVLDSLQC